MVTVPLPSQKAKDEEQALGAWDNRQRLQNSQGHLTHDQESDFLVQVERVHDMKGTLSVRTFDLVRTENAAGDFGVAAPRGHVFQCGPPTAFLTLCSRANARSAGFC